MYSDVIQTAASVPKLKSRLINATLLFIIIIDINFNITQIYLNTFLLDKFQ